VQSLLPDRAPEPAIALSLNVVLKQDYDLSRDLRTRLRRLLELNLQLKPQLDGDDFRAAMNALDTERSTGVREAHRAQASISTRSLPTIFPSSFT
jgi:hypothetical protein